jgi:hypothetical protein
MLLDIVACTRKLAKNPRKKEPAPQKNPKNPILNTNPIKSSSIASESYLHQEYKQ